MRGEQDRLQEARTRGPPFVWGVRVHGVRRRAWGEAMQGVGCGVLVKGLFLGSGFRVSGVGRRLAGVAGVGGWVVGGGVRGPARAAAMPRAPWWS